MFVEIINWSHLKPINLPCKCVSHVHVCVPPAVCTCVVHKRCHELIITKCAGMKKQEDAVEEVLIYNCRLFLLDRDCISFNGIRSIQCATGKNEKLLHHIIKIY